MTENDMNLHAVIDRLLDRLERAHQQHDGWKHTIQAVDKNHPNLVAARAAQIAAESQRDEACRLERGLRTQIAALEAEKHAMADILSNMRVWQSGAMKLLKARNVPKRLWPKEPKA